MKANFNNLTIIVIFFLISTLFSCVGTVQSVDPISTKVSKTSNSTLDNFSGLESAIPISNSKVELFFNPLLTDLDKYSYIITYDGLQVPIYVAANSVQNDYRGLAKFTVNGLESNKKYTFQIQVRDIKTQVESSNNVKISATTFSNLTANFAGISEARNLSGSAGLNGVEIVWPEAEIKGTLVSPNEIDPIEYQITLIDANFLQPNSMNDTTFGEPKRKVVSAAGNKRNLVVNGLKQNTKYYVQVRAIHQGYKDNSANSAYKVEENSNYLPVTTFSEDLANLNYDPNSFFLSLPPGPGGLYAIKANWKIPKGNFEEFRVYYTKQGTSNLNGYLNSADVNSFCFGQEIRIQMYIANKLVLINRILQLLD